MAPLSHGERGPGRGRYRLRQPLSLPDLRTLVTGGAGFIGSHVTDALLSSGDEVAVLDDLSRGRPERLDPSVALFDSGITDAEALAAGVDQTKPQLIYHFAAQIDVRRSVGAPAADAMVNVVGT